MVRFIGFVSCNPLIESQITKLGSNKTLTAVNFFGTQLGTQRVKNRLSNCFVKIQSGGQ